MLLMTLLLLVIMLAVVLVLMMVVVMTMVIIIMMATTAVAAVVAGAPLPVIGIIRRKLAEVSMPDSAGLPDVVGGLDSKVSARGHFRSALFPRGRRAEVARTPRGGYPDTARRLSGHRADGGEP
jgi:archaellum biogenesis protein FlaJ (TadC family)